MNKAFQEARDFAGADWENLKTESRVRLLYRSNLSKHFAGLNWLKLPPTVKEKLAMTLLPEVKK